MQLVVFRDKFWFLLKAVHFSWRKDALGRNISQDRKLFAHNFQEKYPQNSLIQQIMKFEEDEGTMSRSMLP